MIEQHPTWLRGSNPLGLLLEIMEFVWHSFYLLHIPLAVRWTLEDKSEVWRKETGCMMSMLAIPTPLALRIALQPQFSLFYFILFFSFPLSFSALNIALLNIYFSIPQTTQVTGGKKVNLFWFCLILLLLFDAYSSFLILRNCIFYGLLFCLFVFEGGGWGKRKCSHFLFWFFLMFYSMDTWNVIGP